MRSQGCTKNPKATGPGFTCHCDHNGKCCWCGETKESEHGPYVPVNKRWHLNDGPIGNGSLGPLQGGGWYPVPPPLRYDPNVIYCGNDPHKQNTCGGL